MIAIWEREDALGLVFVEVTVEQLVEMPKLCRAGQHVIGTAERIDFVDAKRVWPFEAWREYFA